MMRWTTAMLAQIRDDRSNRLTIRQCAEKRGWPEHSVRWAAWRYGAPPSRIFSTETLNRALSLRSQGRRWADIAKELAVNTESLKVMVCRHQARDRAA